MGPNPFQGKHVIIWLVFGLILLVCVAGLICAIAGETPGRPRWLSWLRERDRRERESKKSDRWSL
jgi:hypothetical protein